MLKLIMGTGTLLFGRSRHVRILKHHGLISSGVAAYTQCMMSVFNCLQLWRDLGAGGEGGANNRIRCMTELKAGRDRRETTKTKSQETNLFQTDVSDVSSSSVVQSSAR